MKIFNSKVQRILQVYKNNKVNDTKGKTKSNKTDKLSLSSKAKEYQIAMNALKKAPDVRKEKVERIKREIELGTYEVNSGKIAEKMLDMNRFDKKA
ncbi:flagellar biosynthesis anti-sigma factor FlgM [Thermohalobacter berrensis]|uniref:Negative regulator of flagellin synthesis n=1 Tax=Thermohalobacter berrensis TaxID=99594 RepID=A0A419T4G7_9FIRM|nr:flagellar biosynthesis anti-sigma factor FlgM [Thermohalobacter berrensis]RKD32326.1 flagellar biosynthesis anti-sigma factor FlgM [Thermohalobacter berrensis]